MATRTPAREQSTPWQQALQTAVDTRSVTSHATVLLLGDVASGKSTLTRHLQSVAAAGSRKAEGLTSFKDTGGASIANSACLPLQKLSDEDQGRQVRSCAILVQQNPSPQKAFDSLVVDRWATSGLYSTAIVITISAAQLLLAYDRAKVWLEFVAQLVPRLIEQTTAAGNSKVVDEFAALRDKKASLIRETSGIEDGFVNVGLPLILCVCKADVLQAQGADEAQFICHLRDLARQYGAGLAAVSSYDKESPNVGRLYRWLCHECRGIASKDKEVLSPLSALYIPVGADTKAALEQLCSEIGRGTLSTPLHTLIHGGTALQETEDLSTAPAQVVVPPTLHEFLAQQAAENEKFVIPEEAPLEGNGSGERALQPVLATSTSKDLKESAEGLQPKQRERKPVATVTTTTEQEQPARTREKVGGDRERRKTREEREQREHRESKRDRETGGTLKAFLLADMKKKDAA